MFEVLETDKSSVFFIGDIHGEFKAIGNWIKTNDLNNCVLIFCGDFGLGFDSIQKTESDLKKSNKLCEERDIDCYIIRGNHDDPSFFITGASKLNLSRFKPLSDYTVVHTPSHNILCAGGAISVDRSYRIQSHRNEVLLYAVRHMCSEEKALEKVRCYWWPDEEFVYNEEVLNEINKAGYRIDVVATHGAPDFCQPLTKSFDISFAKFDTTLEEELIEERKKFTDMYNFLKSQGNEITHWFYGHYHKHNSEKIEGTLFRALDMGRTSKHGGGCGGNFDMQELK